MTYPYRYRFRSRYRKKSIAKAITIAITNQDCGNLEEAGMIFGHEKLHVYQAALQYVEYVYTLADKLKGHHRHARDQLLRASQSIPLNIAEGNGKSSPGDRRRFFEIARGSALECAAIQDVLQVRKVITADENNQSKELLSRIVAMLTKLCQAQHKA